MYSAIDNLDKYLINRDWIVEGTVKNTRRYIPPDHADFSVAYYIDLPADLSSKVSLTLFKEAVNNIAELYEVNIHDLMHVIERDTGIIAFKFRSDDPLISNIKYPKFNVFHKHMTSLLSDSAIFSVTGEFHFNRKKRVSEAQKYLNDCSFLQTEEGSFVVRVELPRETYLIDNDWERGSVKAEKVNAVLLNSFHLASEVVKIDPMIADAYQTVIENNKSLICRNVLEDVKGLYFETDNAPLNIKYCDINSDQNVVIKDSLLNNIQRIDAFNKEVQKLLDNEIDIEIDMPRGAIIALKSKDPDSNANTIIATGYDVLSQRMQHIKLYLNSYRYKEACLAHAHKQSVAIKGIGRQSINQIYLRNPDYFTVNM